MGWNSKYGESVRNIKKRDYGKPKTKWVPLKNEPKLKF
jgi:hypothetical protein